MPDIHHIAQLRRRTDRKGRLLMKNTVKVRILKGRFTGETGLAGYLKYDKTTDRLVVADEEDYPQDDEDDEGNSPF